MGSGVGKSIFIYQFGCDFRLVLQNSLIAFDVRRTLRNLWGSCGRWDTCACQAWRFEIFGYLDGLCLNHTVQKDSREVLGTSFRFGPTSEILENIQYGCSSVVESLQPKEPFDRQRSVILRYCWPSLRLLWLLKSSWSCIVSNPFINVLSICLVPLAGITEENSTVQRDILNYGNICWHVHHL